MQKFLAILLMLALLLTLAACGGNNASKVDSSSASESKTEESSESEDVSEADESSEGADVAVMTHDEYIAAEVDTQVVVETFIQAKQGWWENEGVGVATFYCQSEDGAYFVYNMPCSKEDYDNALTVGTGIRVTGYKAEWSGEVEIVDATYEVMSQTFEATALDVTELLGTEELIAHQNELVAFTGMTVEAANEDGAAFLYKWDGSGSDGDDLYFNVSLNGTTYSFTVESYLCGAGTEVYEAVKALNVGDVIDMEGFLYWYEGVNPHITAVTVK